jgi:retron-type reverse transcriptase
LGEAFNTLDGTKAVGIKGINKKAYGKKLEDNLRNLAHRIHGASYKPQYKRKELIAKMNGKTRPIAISCFEDKLVEWVLGKLLECVYEPLFIRNSFGFRSKKSTDDAVFFFKSKEIADNFVEELFKRSQKFGLTLNNEKTKIINFHREENNSFNFLGFTFYWGTKRKHRKRPLKLKSQKMTLQKKIQEFHLWIKKVRSSSTR